MSSSDLTSFEDVLAVRAILDAKSVPEIRSGSMGEVQNFVIYETLPQLDAAIAFDGPPPPRKARRINRKQKARGF